MGNMDIWFHMEHVTVGLHASWIQYHNFVGKMEHKIYLDKMFIQAVMSQVGLDTLQRD
jgi:hypothetical protein